MIRADGGDQLVAVAPHRHQPRVDRDPHAVAMKHLGVGGVVQAADLRSEIAAPGVTISTVLPASASNSAACMAGMGAVVVVDQHPLRPASRRRTECPRWTRRDRCRLEHMRCSARRRWRGTRRPAPRASTSVGFGVGREAERRRHAPPGAACRQSMMPISSLPSRQRGWQAGPGRPASSAASNSVDLMAARGGDARRLEPARAGADHHHLLRLDRSLRVMTCGIVASRPVAGLWMQTRVIAFVDPIEAIGGADAGADLVLPSLHQQAPDMRVGDVRAGHADHVELAGGDRMARGRHVLDAGGVEHREPRRRAHLAGEVEMRRGAACPGSGSRVAAPHRCRYGRG